MPVRNSIADLKEEAAKWRQELHKNPQTAYEETFASSFIKNKLEEWGIPYKDNIATTGVVATIEGQKNTSGKTIGLRADIDALNITEKTNLPHASQNEGKMHACGHDGHTATLLATAKYLNENRNFDGKVHLVFQPAEEGGRGAHVMIDEGLFEEFPCDYIFGYHNWPEMPLGHVGTRAGPLLAATDEFEITITGRGGHAAMPHLTIDPIHVSAQLVTALQGIVSRTVDPIDTAVLSITNLNSGTGAHNIIPDTAVISGTFRTFKPETREMVGKKMEDICEAVTKMYGASYEMELVDGLDPTINTKDGVDMALEAIKKVVPDTQIDPDCEPCMGAEDFGAFLTKVPGAFIFIGQAVEDQDSPHNFGLHNPYYDFNDDVIPYAASYFATVVEDYMPLD